MIPTLRATNHFHADDGRTIHKGDRLALVNHWVENGHTMNRVECHSLLGITYMVDGVPSVWMVRNVERLDD